MAGQAVKVVLEMKKFRLFGLDIMVKESSTF
jgi:hypothetical protein